MAAADGAWSRIEPHLWRMPGGVLSEAASAGRFPATVEALAAGYRAADAVAGLAGSADPWVIAGVLGVTVRHLPEPPAASPPGARSEYNLEDRTVWLYTDALARLRAAIRLRAARFRHLDLAALHLAHELYHHLEAARPDLVPPAKGGARLSELSAHAFVQALLNLDFFPAELDALAPLTPKEQPA